MRDIPTEGRLDSSLALLHEGYPFIATRCARLHSDVFQARLLLQNTVCLHGEAAARLFYDESLFQRAGAAPAALLGTLLGKGGVQGLDGEAHRVRKRLFVEVLDEAGVAALVSQAEARWREALRHWCRRDSLVLLDEVHRLLTLAVCDWAGVRLAPDEVGLRCAQLVAMIEGGGSVGWRHLEARQARRDAEDWAMGWVRTARRGTAGVAGRPLAAVAAHRDLDGHLLDERTAAVELLNLLRPTVAVARFIVFAALELHRHPAWRERLREAPGACEAFAQEVRRLYAFFPFMAARVRRDFTWRGGGGGGGPPGGGRGGRGNPPAPPRAAPGCCSISPVATATRAAGPRRRASGRSASRRRGTMPWRCSPRAAVTRAPSTAARARGWRWR